MWSLADCLVNTPYSSAGGETSPSQKSHQVAESFIWASCTRRALDECRPFYAAINPINLLRGHTQKKTDRSDSSPAALYRIMGHEHNELKWWINPHVRPRDSLVVTFLTSRVFHGGGIIFASWCRVKRLNKCSLVWRHRFTVISCFFSL